MVTTYMVLMYIIYHTIAGRVSHSVKKKVAQILCFILVAAYMAFGLYRLAKDSLAMVFSDIALIMQMPKRFV